MAWCQLSLQLKGEGYARSTAATVGRAIAPMAVMMAGMNGCLDRLYEVLATNMI